MKMRLRGLKKQPCPPIIRWMGTGWGGAFDPLGSARYELKSLQMKCAEACVQHKYAKECWYSPCSCLSCGIGLLVDIEKTPLFRCYNHDAYTNNRGNSVCKHPKENTLYSAHMKNRGVGKGKIVYVTSYGEILSMIEKYPVKGWHTEANVGNGKKPVVYKAVIVDRDRGEGVMEQAMKMAKYMNLPLIKCKGGEIRKSALI